MPAALVENSLQSRTNSFASLLVVPTNGHPSPSPNGSVTTTASNPTPPCAVPKISSPCLKWRSTLGAVPTTRAHEGTNLTRGCSPLQRQQSLSSTAASGNVSPFPGVGAVPVSPSHRPGMMPVSPHSRQTLSPWRGFESPPPAFTSRLPAQSKPSIATTRAMSAPSSSPGSPALMTRAAPVAISTADVCSCALSRQSIPAIASDAPVQIVTLAPPMPVTTMEARSSTLAFQSTAAIAPDAPARASAPLLPSPSPILATSQISSPPSQAPDLLAHLAGQSMVQTANLSSPIFSQRQDSAVRRLSFSDSPLASMEAESLARSPYLSKIALAATAENCQQLSNICVSELGVLACPSQESSSALTTSRTVPGSPTSVSAVTCSPLLSSRRQEASRVSSPVKSGTASSSTSPNAVPRLPLWNIKPPPFALSGAHERDVPVVLAEPSTSVSVFTGVPVVIACTASPTPASDLALDEDNTQSSIKNTSPESYSCLTEQAAIGEETAPEASSHLAEEATDVCLEENAKTTSTVMRMVTPPVAPRSDMASVGAKQSSDWQRPCSRSVSPAPPRSAGEAAPPMPHMMLGSHRVWPGMVTPSLVDSTQALTLTVEMATTLVAELSQLALTSTTSVKNNCNVDRGDLVTSKSATDLAKMQRALHMVTQVDDAIGNALKRCSAQRDANARLLEVHRLGCAS